MTKTVNPVWEQTGYRYRNDDGSQTAATWIAALNTAPASPIDVDTIFRLRIQVSETAGATGTPTFVGKLQYSLDSGTWTDVSTTTPVQFTASADTTWTISDGDATTEQLAGSQTFQAGTMEENATWGSIAAMSSEDTEYEAVLTIDSAQVTDAQTLDFRVVHGASSEQAAGTVLTYTQAIGQIEINDTAPQSITPALVSQLIDPHEPTVFEDKQIDPALVSQLISALAPVVDLASAGGGGPLGIVYAEQTTEQSVSGLTLSTVLTVAGSNFEQGDYLILFTANMGMNSASYYANCELQLGGTQITDSDQAIDPSTSTSTKGKPYQWMGKITQGATPSDVTFKIAASDASATAYAGMQSFLAIPLGDLDTGDYEFASNSTLDAHTTSWQDGASITFDGGSEDWLVIGCMVTQIDGTTVSGQARMVNGSNVVPQATFEGRDAAEVLGHVMSRAFTSVGSSQTFKLQYQDTATATNDHLYSAIFALRLDAFTHHGQTWTAAASSALGSAYAEVDGLLFTPNETGEHLIWHTGIWDVPDSDDWIYGRLQVGGTTVGATEDGRSIQKSKDATDERPVWMFAVEDWTDTNQKDVDVDYDDDNSTGGTIKDRQILVLSWELVGGAALTIDPAVVTELVTAFAPTLTTGNVDIVAALITELVTTHDPTLAVGNVNIEPAWIARLVSSYAPDLLPGNVNVEPAVASELVGAFDPTLAASVNIDPALVSELVGAFDPSVAVGAITLLPALVTDLIAASDPTLLVEQFVEPAAALQLLAALDPTLATNVNIAPALATDLLAAIDPTITTGNVNITTALASELVAAFGPTVSVSGGTQYVTPILASQLLAALDPQVTPGNVNMAPALASALLAAIDPTITVGNVNIETGLVSELLAAIGPTVIPGGIALDPTLESQPITAHDPTLEVGNVNIDPALASQLATPFDPTVAVDDLILEPALASQLLTALDPQVTANIGIDPAHVAQLIGAIDPSLSVGAALIQPSVVARLLSAFEVSITGGRLTARTAGTLYRRGDNMLVLVWDRHRGMGTGFKPSEGWEIASNTFAHTGTTEARNQIMDAVESAWNANKARDIVFLRFALNNALHAANYRTMAGGDVNSSDPEVT